MLQQAIDFLQDHRIIETEWTVNDRSATTEYCHIGIPDSVAVILHPEMLGDRMRLTIAYCGDDPADNRVYTAAFRFIDEEANSITEFVADSIGELFEHVEAIFLRD